MSTELRPRWIATPALALLLSACGGATPPSENPGAVVPPDAGPVAETRPILIPQPPKVCGTRVRTVSRVAEGPLPKVSNDVADSALAWNSSGSKDDNEWGKVYDKLGPATVFVQVGEGFGTGVVVDPHGLVLTNWHVVREGVKPDFTVAADVSFGKSENGAMKKEVKSYKASVIKYDAARDLALLKLVDAPADLPHVKLTKYEPSVGSPVFKIGHAAMGFAWAGKACQISGVGTLKDVAKNLYDCDKVGNTSATPAQARMAKKECEEQMDSARKASADFNAAMLLQTDCQLAPGDSGGPLVDKSGALVGVNVIGTSSGVFSYHVHAGEVKDFLSHDVGTEPVRALPDPWCDGGEESMIEDADLDGKIDTLVVEGRGDLPPTFYFDIDQDTFSRPRDDKAMPFDAEVVISARSNGIYVWYDRDNDGRFDLVLVDSEREGQPSAAYTITADGKYEPEGSFLKDKNIVHDLAPEILQITDASVIERGRRIFSSVPLAAAIGPRSLASSKLPAPPDPIWGGGRKGKVLDTDNDGRGDVLALQSAFSRGLLLDPTQSVLGQFKQGDDAQAAINDRKTGARLSIVSQGRLTWYSYDRKGNGQFDLVLLANGQGGIQVTEAAWTRRDDGTLEPAPDQVGRWALRPSLISGGHMQSFIDALPADASTDEGIGSLPNPRLYGSYVWRDPKGISRDVVVAASNTTTTYLFDATHRSKLAPKADATGAVRSGAFKADLAYVTNFRNTWVYYDADQDGRWDFVVFTTAPSSGRAEKIFRVDGNALKIEPASGNLLRTTGMFKKPATAKALQKMLKQVFKNVPIDD